MVREGVTTDKALDDGSVMVGIYVLSAKDSRMNNKYSAWQDFQMQ